MIRMALTQLSDLSMPCAGSKWWYLDSMGHISPRDEQSLSYTEARLELDTGHPSHVAVVALPLISICAFVGQGKCNLGSRVVLGLRYVSDGRVMWGLRRTEWS